LLEPSAEAKRNYYMVIAAMVSMQVTTSTIYMVLPVFFKLNGVSNTESGVLIAIGTFAGIISSFLAGRYSDTHGRKPVLLVGMAMYSAVFYLFAMGGKDFNTFFILRFIEGLGFYITPVAVMTIAGDIFPSKQRGKAMALYTMASGIGQLLGPLGAGYFIEAATYTTYFILCGVFVTIGALVVVFFVKETLPEAAKKKAEEDKAKKRTWSLSGIVHDTRALGAAVGFFFVAILFYRTGNTMVNPFLSIYLTEELHVTMGETGWFFAIRAFMTLTFAPLAGWMADKWGRKIPFLGGISLLVATMLGYRMVTSFDQVLLIRALESISNAVLMPTTRAMVTDLLTPENRAFGNGLYNTLVDESSTMGSIAGGWIYDLYGFGTVFGIGAVTAAACMAVVAFKVPEPKNLPHNLGRHPGETPAGRH
jgi:DHA1 family multidrug resistance protein-like MFS transporter